MQNRFSQASNLTAVQQETARLRAQVRERSLTYLLAAFGLVAGLAWNDAITALIGHLFPASSDSVIAKFIYAVIITVVVVLITTVMVRLMQGPRDNA